FERARAWGEPSGRDRRERRHGDVLELVGDDVAILRERRQGGGVLPFGAGKPRADFGRDRIPFGSVDMAAVAELRRGHRQHPPELAAAEDADGRTGQNHAALPLTGWVERSLATGFDRLSMSGVGEAAREPGT